MQKEILKEKIKENYAKIALKGAFYLESKSAGGEEED